MHTHAPENASPRAVSPAKPCTRKLTAPVHRIRSAMQTLCARPLIQRDLAAASRVRLVLSLWLSDDLSVRRSARIRADMRSNTTAAVNIVQGWLARAHSGLAAAAQAKPRLAIFYKLSTSLEQAGSRAAAWAPRCWRGLTGEALLSSVIHSTSLDL